MFRDDEEPTGGIATLTSWFDNAKPLPEEAHVSTSRTVSYFVLASLFGGAIIGAAVSIVATVVRAMSQ